MLKEALSPLDVLEMRFRAANSHVCAIPNWPDGTASVVTVRIDSEAAQEFSHSRVSNMLTGSAAARAGRLEREHRSERSE